MSSPILRQGLQRKIILLLFRATHVQGSTSVITRSSLLSWAQVRAFMKRIDFAETNDPIMGKLIQECFNTCDKGRIDAWSDGGVERMLELVSKA